MNRPPDLSIANLNLWVHGREFDQAEDYWDGNWLRVTANASGAGAQVNVEGPIVHLSELLRFLDACESLYKANSGEALLACTEPNLRIELRSIDEQGHFACKINITADHMNQSHQFLQEINQTYLPEIIRSCGRLLEQFPIRGKP